ncbi:C39 family peptidase [Pseudanabaena sp. FACHB-1998]|uniref:C39 family peptidase n=1 Tax=Pseudanabaena sp. FACHB-1998 TaxID=2692858 RepID=UPI0016816B2F|nr:C39 family peptidase [Pseudanabaena sp. FACHB-1998]MBD2177451.1 C39 family peptidase [Pseudanabaena sp. FACHB-1998]
MPKAIAEADTFLKKKLLGSTDLADSEKIFIKKGQTFFVTEYGPDRNQHLSMTLASPLPAKDGKTMLQKVYAYDPHVKIEGEDLNRLIKLPVKYCCQLDNDEAVFGPGWRQCNTTSNTMLADFLLGGELTRQAQAQGFPEPESVYMRIVGKYGDTTDHDAQTWALKEIGIDSYFSYSLSANDLLLSLKANIPVVVGFAYKGSGHICIIVGHDPDKKVWLVHDPYGTRHGADDSYDVGVGGQYDPYDYSVMQQIFWDSGGEAGWGRIVTSVKGKPTGLPSGL